MDEFRLEHIIGILSNALKYYEPSEKYEDNIKTTYGYTCEIALDEGSMARKALETVNEIRREYNDTPRNG